MKIKINIIKKNVKKFNLRIKENMVYMSVPLDASDEEIEFVLNKNRKWIDTKIKIHETKKDELIYLGEKYNFKIFQKDFEETIINEKTILIYTNEIEFEKIIKSFYYSRADMVFKEILDKYLLILNEKVNKVTIKNMQTRWGSCNFLKRYINLNIQLIEKPIECIEYVIMHELAHLKYPNHSKDFYEYIYKYMEDYKDRILLLKK